METINPTKPVAPYLGGKRNLAKRIIEIISGIDHQTYAEPFVGMGGVFLRRTQRPRCEVINDLNREVSTFFRILQRHYVPFMEMMRFQITTRAEFARLVATDPDTLTDLERAARFLYIQRAAFGGRPRGPIFGVSTDRPGRFDISQVGPMLDDLHTRMSGVVIECLPYGEFIRRYDRPGTLFYLDPPYLGSEGDYGPDLFKRSDFQGIADALSALQGRFIMSINDTPEIRDVFSGFSFEEVSVTYTVARKATGSRAGELIITG